MRQMVYAMHK